MREQELKKFQPGGHGTFEAATAHHKYNKESTALREMYRHIYKNNAVIKTQESVGTFDGDAKSELSRAGASSPEIKQSLRGSVAGPISKPLEKGHRMGNNRRNERIAAALEVN